MSEAKVCKKCKTDFIIESEDFAFYEKIGVPAPTLCPACRMQRRMYFFNERSLYRRTCGLCKKEVISAHRPDAPHPVFCQPCWWSDAWDPLSPEYGGSKEYDLSRTFFEQFRDLRDLFPLPAMNNIYTSNVNSEYVNMCSYLKNCYLCFNSDYNEDSSFSCYLEKSKWCYDVDHGYINEYCYDSIGLFKCYRVKYSANIEESMDVMFSRDLKNCSNCFGCVNLRGKQYCIFNEQKTKETYFEELKKYDLTSLEVVLGLKKQCEEFFLKYPRKLLTGIQNKNVVGDYIFNSKNVTQSYDIVGGEDCKYCQFFIIEGSKNCMDVTMWGSHLTQAYECMGVGNKQNNVLFCWECWNEATNMTYCKHILAPNSDLFGCIGLRNKQYCILNKLYSKEEYERQLSAIKSQMLSAGEYGEFFPVEMSLYGYNETFANKYLPLSKEEALAKGFRWSDPEARNYEIGGDIIGCEHKEQCGQQCTGAFKLTENEKGYYQMGGLPTPNLCPNCRHYERIKIRNPIEFYHRNCGKCGVEISTNYSPDRLEIVYCETCYLSEVA